MGKLVPRVCDRLAPGFDGLRLGVLEIIRKLVGTTNEFCDDIFGGVPTLAGFDLESTGALVQ
jgi:hypothetical protein